MNHIDEDVAAGIDTDPDPEGGLIGVGIGIAIGIEEAGDECGLRFRWHVRTRVARG